MTKIILAAYVVVLASTGAYAQSRQSQPGAQAGTNGNNSSVKDGSSERMTTGADASTGRGNTDESVRKPSTAAHQSCRPIVEDKIRTQILRTKLGGGSSVFVVT